jgi:hypothetical protein
VAESLLLSLLGGAFVALLGSLVTGTRLAPTEALAAS